MLPGGIVCLTPRPYRLFSIKSSSLQQHLLSLPAMTEQIPATTERIPATRKRKEPPKRKAALPTKRQQLAKLAKNAGNNESTTAVRAIPLKDAAAQFILQGRLSREDIEIYKEM